MNEAEYLKSEEQNIRQIAKKRIREIKGIMGDHYLFPKKVLDLGSNHGFYLDEYRKVGWLAWGVENGEEYKGIPGSFAVDIRHFDFSLGGYNVITAFCILEHFTARELKEIAYRMENGLAPGGLVVIKSPYCKGLTGRFAPKKYYLDPNHKVEITDPIKYFKRLKLVKTVIEGIHPERVFPRFGKTKLARWLTEKLRMGDARVYYMRKT